MQYPRYCKRLFAIPNGGHRNLITAKRLKKEGVLSGVPDLLLAVPRNGRGGLFIEMKNGKAGRLSPDQKAMLEELGNDYEVKIARNVDDFIAIIKTYL